MTMNLGFAQSTQRWTVLVVLVSALLVSNAIAQAPVITGTVPSRPLTELEQSNLLQCIGMIQRVMMTGATQPGLNDVASEIYDTVNPGPYPWSNTVDVDPADWKADYRLVHPFLPPYEPISVTLAGLDQGLAEALFEEGRRNASALASSTCCDGTLFGYAVPFSQAASNEIGDTELGESSLRYYVAMSGKANQTDTTWYTTCPYTSIPATARVNSNFPESASRGWHLALAIFVSIVPFLAV
jgi:hypothetical protein